MPAAIVRSGVLAKASSGPRRDTSVRIGRCCLKQEVEYTPPARCECGVVAVQGRARRHQVFELPPVQAQVS